jgi:hypothetical protein
LKGYSYVSDFLNESLEWLILKWIGVNREITSIPFLMCDPDLLEMLLTLGFASVLIVMDSSAVVLLNFDLSGKGCNLRRPAFH